MGAFAKAGINFHLRSAAVFLHDGHVLLHRAVGDTIWALPGGHVEPWEDTAATLVRECREEIEAEVSVGELLWVAENYWTDRNGRNHEVGFYYRVELDDPAWHDTNRVYFGREELGGAGETLQLEFRWFPLSAVPGLELYPTFLRQALLNPPPHTVHIIDRAEADA